MLLPWLTSLVVINLLKEFINNYFSINRKNFANILKILIPFIISLAEFVPDNKHFGYVCVMIIPMIPAIDIFIDMCTSSVPRKCNSLFKVNKKFLKRTFINPVIYSGLLGIIIPNMNFILRSHRQHLGFCRPCGTSFQYIFSCIALLSSNLAFMKRNLDSWS